MNDRAIVGSEYFEGIHVEPAELREQMAGTDMKAVCCAAGIEPRRLRLLATGEETCDLNTAYRIARALETGITGICSRRWPSDQASLLDAVLFARSRTTPRPTNAGIARNLGVTGAYIGMILNGRCAITQGRTESLLKEIASTFGVYLWGSG